MRRTQIYLGEEQHRALVARARAAHRTTSDLIRGAIDELLARPDDSDERLAAFRAAVAATAGAAPDLPRGDEYVEEVRTGDRRPA